MTQNVSKQRLISIAQILLAEEGLDRPELRPLIDEFEDSLMWPHAVDLIFFNKREFKDAAESVDFLLGHEEVRKLSRAELIEVVRKLMNADTRNDVHAMRLYKQFEVNVPHPDGGDLIFYPKIEFDSPEELVDYALSYGRTGD